MLASLSSTRTAVFTSQRAGRVQVHLLYNFFSPKPKALECRSGNIAVFFSPL
jgi:hypothetical protein